MPDVSRRDVLGAAGGVVLAMGSVPAAAQSDDACHQLEERRAVLADERAYLDSIQTTPTTSGPSDEEMLAAIESARTSMLGDHPYDEALRERALSVGLAARPGVVFMHMDERHGSATASGWFVEEDLILTNSHNVNNADTATELSAWTLDGTELHFEVVDRVETNSPDVALIRTAGDTPATLPTGTADDLGVGDTVVQVGPPGGFGNWVISLGEVVDGPTDDLRTTVPGLRGVSGSPLLNMDGTVVGMTYAGAPSSSTSTGGAPEPGSTSVRQYPFATDDDSLHVPIDAAMAKLEEWT